MRAVLCAPAMPVRSREGFTVLNRGCCLSGHWPAMNSCSVQSNSRRGCTVELTIAVISYNTRDLLLACLKSIQDTTKDVEYELVVIDNASSDGSATAVRAQFPQVRVISNHDNGGYAKACNQVVLVGRGQYLLFLNSDTVMRSGTLCRMMACLELQPDVGAVSCLQRNEAGQVLRSCFPFPSVRDHLRYSVWIPTIIKQVGRDNPELDFTVSQDVEWANGACLMVRKELFEQLGGFDHRFFMYFEDVDLCRRIHQRGYRVRHAADGEIVHLIGRSSVEHRDQLNVQWEL
ncbi:MAG: glycosyltransferase family 2 protein, partial [Nitrospiraceae bacterium]